MHFRRSKPFSTGCYGNRWIRTPHIDRFAAGATVFENAYLGSYPTLPCRREVVTGRYEFPWRGWGGLDADDVTIAGLVRDAGKISHLITDVYHHWGKDAGNFWTPFSGFELIRGQERDNFITDADVGLDHPTLGCPRDNIPEHSHFRNAQFLRRNEEDWFTAQVFRRAARWVQHNASHRDFFLMIDAFDPHEPWDAPRHYVNLYDDAPGVREICFPIGGPVEGRLTSEELRRTQALYAAEVSLVDRWFGYFIEQVELMGLLENTLVILTSDHGTHNGDHGRIGKNYILYDEIAHVPLIIRHPQFGRGARARQIVQAVDYFPTIAEAIGVESPNGLHGHSLMPILHDPSAASSPREMAFYGEFRQAMYLANADWTYAQGVRPDSPPIYSYTHFTPKGSTGWGPFDGVRRRPPAKSGGTERAASRLYDKREDPGETVNLLNDRPEKAREFQEQISGILRRIGAPVELFDRFGLFGRESRTIE